MKKVALQYTQGKTPTVLRMRIGMVDKGADLSPLSQYPGEKEVCGPPLANLEVTGTSGLGAILVSPHSSGGLVTTPPMNLHPPRSHFEKALKHRQE